MKRRPVPSGVPCPRCDKSPIEVARISEAEPWWLPACSCYPHPPLCVVCGEPLEDGRCAGVGCQVSGVLQPLPDVDELWPVVAGPDAVASGS